MESIYINNMQVHGHHGVLPQERRVGNDFVINVRIDVPHAQQAMMSDSIDDTINYAEIIDIVKHEMATPSKLIENVAWRIRQAICKRWPHIAGGEVSVAKLAPPVSAQLQSVAFATQW